MIGARPVCFGCKKPAKELLFRAGKYFCQDHAGPATCDDAIGTGPKLCATCGEPVNPKSGEDECEPCRWNGLAP